MNESVGVKKRNEVRILCKQDECMRHIESAMFIMYLC